MHLMLGPEEHVPVLQYLSLGSARSDCSNVLWHHRLNPVLLHLGHRAGQHRLEPPVRHRHACLSHVDGKLQQDYDPHEARRALPNQRAQGHSGHHRLQRVSDGVHEGAREPREIEDLLEEPMHVSLILLPQAVPFHVLAQDGGVDLRPQLVIHAQHGTEVQAVAQNVQQRLRPTQEDVGSDLPEHLCSAEALLPERLHGLRHVEGLEGPEAVGGDLAGRGGDEERQVALRQEHDAAGLDDVGDAHAPEDQLAPPALPPQLPHLRPQPGTSLLSRGETPAHGMQGAVPRD
mmetsp:Transcript_42327/g.101172  ORF Transcript_42327/g.101172 Transcript_42327/m.101172 type:complete len:289 (+) Transcript_42327:728-1594(+)